MKRPEGIEQYLEDLDDSLEVSLRRRRRILSEARSHLEEAAEAEQREGASRDEAERRARAEFGAPEPVAASHGGGSAGPLGRVVVGLADGCFRVGEYIRDPRGRREVVQEFIYWAALSVLCLGPTMLWDIISPGPPILWDLSTVPLTYLPAPFVLLFLLAAAITAVKTWTALRSLPRPGYMRRWLKLDRAAHERILRALGGGAPVTDCTEVAFSREVRARSRGFRPPLWLWGPPAVLAAAAAAFSLFVLAFGNFSASGAFYMILWALPSWWLVRGSRLARRRAKAELVALDILHEVAAAALDSGRARLDEGTIGTMPASPGALRFCFVPLSPSASPVSLGIKRGVIGLQRDVIRLSLAPDRYWKDFDPYDDDDLHELRLTLAEVIAAPDRESIATIVSD